MHNYEYLVHIPYTDFEATVRIRSVFALPYEDVIIRALNTLEDNGFDNAWRLKPSSDTIEIITL